MDTKLKSPTSSDRRKKKRRSLKNVKTIVKLHCEDRIILGEIVDISEGGAGMELLRGNKVSPGTGLSIVAEGCELKARVSNIVPLEGRRMRVGVEFREGGKNVVKFIEKLDSIENAEGAPKISSSDIITIDNDFLINRILSLYLFHRKGRIYLFDSRKNPLGHGYAYRDGKFIRIECKLTVKHIEENNLNFTFNGYISCYSFRERIVSFQDHSIRILPPLSLIKRLRRRYPRTSSTLITAFFQSNEISGRYLPAKVLDLGFDGFSVEFNHPVEEIFTSNKFEKIVIELPGAGEVQCAGRLIYISTGKDELASDVIRAGIQIDSFFRNCGKVWRRYVFNLMIPSLSDEGFDFEAREFYEVLKKSGYLSLTGKSIEFYEPILPSFIKSFEKSAVVEGERQFIHHFGDRLMGVASRNRIYSRTFLLHQLGIDHKGEELFISKEKVAKHILIGLFVDSYLTEDILFYSIYFSAEKKWNKFMYDDFLIATHRKDLYFYRSYRFLEYDLTSISDIGDYITYTDVKMAEGELVNEVSDFLRRVTPEIVFEAYDYSADKIDLSAHRKIVGSEFARERTIFYTQKFGQITGVAVAESSRKTINLFNIGDSVRVYLGEDVPEDEKLEIKVALLKKTICYFASKCKPYFIYFCYDDDPDYALALGFKAIDKSRELIMKRQLLPSYIDFIEMTLSSIEILKR